MSAIFLVVRIAFAIFSLVRELEKKGLLKKEAILEVRKEFEGVRSKLGVKYEKQAETSP